MKRTLGENERAFVYDKLKDDIARSSAEEPEPESSAASTAHETRERLSLVGMRASVAGAQLQQMLDAWPAESAPRADDAKGAPPDR